VEKFLEAVETYRREQRRPFPSWNEILDVACALGHAPVDPGA
jgi:hypothetical protein